MSVQQTTSQIQTKPRRGACGRRLTVVAVGVLASFAFAGQAHALAVNQISGHDDKWNSTDAMQITYCVKKVSFGADYNQVVTALNAAAANWEATARVNFIHKPALDYACSNLTAVTFNVRKVTSGQFSASAFYPSTPRLQRELRIDQIAFGVGSTLTGVLRHELGHTLGFRHEHTRPEAKDDCFEDSKWRALTTYDSASVMHYPTCGGTSTGGLELTQLDMAGARILYP